MIQIAALIFIIFSLFSFSKHTLAEKVWPREPLRGINTTLVANEKGNTQNPGGYPSEEMFKKYSKWNINLIRVFLNVDHYSIWAVNDGKGVPPVPDDNLFAPYTKHLEGLRVVLELAEKYKIYVILVAGNVLNRKSGILYNSTNKDAGFQKNHNRTLATYS